MERSLQCEIARMRRQLGALVARLGATADDELAPDARALLCEARHHAQLCAAALSLAQRELEDAARSAHTG